MKPIVLPLRDLSLGVITWNGTDAIKSDGVIHGDQEKGEIDLDNSDTDCDDYNDCDEDNKFLVYTN